MAGEAPPNAEVHAVLQMCGVADADTRNLLIQNEGFETLEDIAILESDADLTEMAKRSASRTMADGRVLLGTVQIKRMQGLVWWLHDRMKHQQPLIFLKIVQFHHRLLVFQQL